MLKNNDISILVVDDGESSLLAVSKGLEKMDYKVSTASSGKQAIDLILKQNFHIIVSDLKMPDVDGKEVLKIAKQKNPSSLVIIMTGFSSVESAVELMQEGAFHYLKKPIDINELRNIIKRGIEQINLIEFVENQSKRIEYSYGMGKLVVQSKKMQDLMQKIPLISQSKSTVLIEGESGTGKEVVTRLIHKHSAESNEEFIAVNCSAFTETLLESQLFGHEKGSFTGASQTQKGLFESAGKGCIFLDEIGEMSLNVQAKFLRVLESKEFMRVGSSKTLKSEARIIAATNKDLLNEVNKGNFREDLYYRLTVLRLQVPPLRDRREDIIPLAQYYCEEFSEQNKKALKILSTDARELLFSYHWPGNVRELKNLIERIFIIHPQKLIKAADIKPHLIMEVGQLSGVQIILGDDLSQIEKKAILETLRFTNGNRTKTADILKIGLRTLQRKLKEYQIND